MTEYSLTAMSAPTGGVNITVPIPQPVATFVAAASAKPVVLRWGTNISYTSSGGSPALGLGRPLVSGTTANNITVGLPIDDSNAPTPLSILVTDWGVPPAPPTQFMRRYVSPFTNGAGVLWEFPRGLGFPAGGQLALFLVNTGNSALVYDTEIVFDE